MKYTVPVKTTEDGEQYIEFPPEAIAAAGWKEGDTIDWKDNGDGSYSLTKKEIETEWVLVETVSTYRHRYMVEVPKGKDEWALDVVTMEDAKEFGQEYLSETIISHRTISEKDAIILCDRDNGYAKSWSEDHKKTTFFTYINDYEK